MCIMQNIDECTSNLKMHYNTTTILPVVTNRIISKVNEIDYQRKDKIVL